MSFPRRPTLTPGMFCVAVREGLQGFAVFDASPGCGSLSSMRIQSLHHRADLRNIRLFQTV